MNSALTCVTCRVLFHESGLHRDHYKGDWHRYNLKRKVVELPPVTLEAFDEKARQQAEANDDATENKQKTKTSESESDWETCRCCKKSFKSAKQFENHCQSAKHVALLGREEGTPRSVTTQSSVVSSRTDPVVPEVDDEDDDDDWESVSDSSDEDVQESSSAAHHGVCLFCDRRCVQHDVSALLRHMHARHGFYVLDQQFCTNVLGLLACLRRHIVHRHQCLTCAKPFRSLDAVQKHMAATRHIRMRADMSALEKYYDYSSTYPNAENPDVELEHDFGALVVNENMELLLPTGSTLGHRSLLRYYRQRLRPVSAVALHGSAQQKRRRVPQALLAHRGFGGAVATTIQRREHKLRKIDRRFMTDVSQKHRMRLGVKQNKLNKFYKRENIIVY